MEEETICEECGGKGEYIEIDQVVKCRCQKPEVDEDNYQQDPEYKND